MGLTWAAFQALGNTWDTEVGLSSSNPHQPWRRDPSLKEAPDFASEVRMCQDVVGQLRRCQLSKLPVSYACVRLGPTTCTPSVPLCFCCTLGRPTAPGPQLVGRYQARLGLAAWMQMKLLGSLRNLKHWAGFGCENDSPSCHLQNAGGLRLHGEHPPVRA